MRRISPHDIVNKHGDDHHKPYSQCNRTQQVPVTEVINHLPARDGNESRCRGRRVNGMGELHDEEGD